MCFHLDMLNEFNNLKKIISADVKIKIAQLISGKHLLLYFLKSNCGHFMCSKSISIL